MRQQLYTAPGEELSRFITRRYQSTTKASFLTGPHDSGCSLRVRQAVVRARLSSASPTIGLRAVLLKTTQ